MEEVKEKASEELIVGMPWKEMLVAGVLGAIFFVGVVFTVKGAFKVVGAAYDAMSWSKEEILDLVYTRCTVGTVNVVSYGVGTSTVEQRPDIECNY